MATAGGHVAVDASTGDIERSRVQGHGLDRAPGGAPASRRSSAARVGPRNGDVGQAPAELLGDDRRLDRRGQRTAVLGGDPELAPAGGGHGGIELGGPLGVVELARRPVGPSRSTTWRRGVAERVLLRGEPDVHQSPCVGAATGCGPLVAERAAQHLARRQCGGSRRRRRRGAGACRWRASRRRAAASSPSATAGPGRAAPRPPAPRRPARRHPEHRAVEHGGMAVEHRLDLGRCDLEAADLDHLLASGR